LRPGRPSVKMRHVRAVRTTTAGVGVVTVPDPPVEADGVRVSVAASGICGSDLHLVTLGPSEVTLGHEFSGTVDDGTRVAVLPAVPCGRCARCGEGDDQQCAQALGTLYGVARDGGLAEQAWIAAQCARPLPAGLQLRDACLAEPLAVALHGLHRVAAASGARALVIGGGPIGLCAVAVARDHDIEVDLLAHRPERLAAGERLGARPTPGTGYDVVFDAAGTQGSMDAALERVRPGGTVAVLGTFWDQVSLGLGFQLKEVTLVPAFAYGHHHGDAEFDAAISLLARTPDLPAALITHRFALDDAAEAFRIAADRESGAIKVVLEP
jgi:threonine dehydrogenase-like Zn-dependent dehydrogenase